MDPLQTHIQLFGKSPPPSEKQSSFYSLPDARGFSTQDRDPALTDAVIIRALAQVRTDKLSEYLKVWVIFPNDQREWVIGRIHALATHTMTRLQPILKDEKGKLAIAHIRRWLEALQIGPLEAWKGAGAPDRWVSYGYLKEDSTVPEWCRKGLV